MTVIAFGSNCVNPVCVKISSSAALFYCKSGMWCSQIRERQCLSFGTYVSDDLMFLFCTEPKQLLYRHKLCVFSVFSFHPRRDHTLHSLETFLIPLKCHMEAGLLSQETDSFSTQQWPAPLQTIVRVNRHLSNSTTHTHTGAQEQQGVRLQKSPLQSSLIRCH